LDEYSLAACGVSDCGTVDPDLSFENGFRYSGMGPGTSDEIQGWVIYQNNLNKKVVKIGWGLP
jgi:hypothetical protein